MTRGKPGKQWRRTGNKEDPNKRPRRTAQLSSLPAATNVHVETDQQYLAQGSVAQESISTVDSIEDNEEPSSRSAFRHPPDGLTTELHGNAEYDPSQSFEEAFPDVGDWTYDDGHMFSEGFEEGLSEECAEESNFIMQRNYCGTFVLKWLISMVSGTKLRTYTFSCT